MKSTLLKPPKLVGWSDKAREKADLFPSRINRTTNPSPEDSDTRWALMTRTPANHPAGSLPLSRSTTSILVVAKAQLLFEPKKLIVSSRHKQSEVLTDHVAIAVKLIGKHALGDVHSNTVFPQSGCATCQVTSSP
jgi:hypothetical protein